MLELLALGSDEAAAREVATRVGGIACVSGAGESDRRPYSTLVRASTDNIEAISEVADIALHVAFARVIKALDGPPPPERVIASFPLIHHPDLTHRQADDHWRDIHGPLAYASHSAMCDYTQLSIVATISGRELDGVALCAFPTRDDLRDRFFNDDEARAAIEADVASFANLEKSPRRVVLT
ncbi:MAG: EthD domain-containing protein, partial [Actinomycetia bacterium]|nr:EthD domain-containing protein [Actinomycetes bacterium]